MVTAGFLFALRNTQKLPHMPFHLIRILRLHQSDAQFLGSIETIHIRLIVFFHNIETFMREMFFKKMGVLDERLVELRGVAGFGVAEYIAFEIAYGKLHAESAAGGHAEQFRVDEIADASPDDTLGSCQGQGVGEIPEWDFLEPGKQQTGQDHPQHGAMKRQSSFPDRERGVIPDERIVGSRLIINEHIDGPRTDNQADKQVDQEVVNKLTFQSKVAYAAEIPRKLASDEKAQKIHNAVPAHSDAADLE